MTCAATKPSGVLYGINKGDTLHILISSSPDDPPYPDGGIPRLRKGVAVGVERSDSEREAISYRDAYCRHPRLAFRRYSEQILTSPTEQTISGLGWNATWRSAHSRRPITYRQRSVPDSKLVTSAEEAIRILLGDRSTEHSETERSGAASSSDRRVRDRGTGSFTLRSSYAPTPDMDDNKAAKVPIRKSLDEALKKIADSRQRLARLINQKSDGNGGDYTNTVEMLGNNNNNNTKRHLASCGQGKSQVEKTKAMHPIRTKATSTNTKDRMELAKTERKDTDHVNRSELAIKSKQGGEQESGCAESTTHTSTNTTATSSSRSPARMAPTSTVSRNPELSTPDGDEPVSNQNKTPSNGIPVTIGQQSRVYLASGYTRREAQKPTGQPRRQYSRSGQIGDKVTITGKPESKRQLIYPWKKDLRPVTSKDREIDGEDLEKRERLERDVKDVNLKSSPSGLPPSSSSRTTATISSSEEPVRKSPADSGTSSGGIGSSSVDSVSDIDDDIPKLLTTAPPIVDEQPPLTARYPTILPDQMETSVRESQDERLFCDEQIDTPPPPRRRRPPASSQSSSSSSSSSSSYLTMMRTSRPENRPIVPYSLSISDPCLFARAAKEVRTEQTEPTNSDNPNQLRANEDAKLERVDNSNKSNIDCSCSVSKTTGSSGSSVDNAEWYVGSVNGGNPVTGEVLDTHQSVKVSEHLASKPRLKPDDSSTKRELCSSEMTSNKHQPENGEKPAVEKKEQTWTSRLFGKLSQRWDQSRQKQIPESVSPESSEVTENGPASEKTSATSELTVASSPALVETSDDGEVGLASVSSTTSSASSGKPENAISEVDITIPEQSEMTSHFDVDDSSTTSKSASSEIDDDSKQEDNQLYTASGDVFMTEHVDEKNVSSDKIKTKVSTFSIQMSAPATDNNEGHSPKSIDKDVTEITNERTGLADTDTAVNPDTSSVAASTSTEKAGHSETTRLDSVVVVDKVDPEPMVDNAVEELVASRPEMGAVRQRSHSTPCPTNGALTVAIEPVGGLVTGCDVTNEVNEFQHQAPEIRSPLISGYSQLTSELIRAKLREKRESTMNQMDDGGHPESNLDAVRMDIPPHLEPYMFARNTRHTISPEETLKRIEMLKKRRRYLSSGNLLDSDTADDADGDAETQTDASEMYVRTEEKVLTQIRRMKGEEETFVDVRTGGSLVRSGAYGTSLDYNTIELVVKELQLEKKAQMEGMLALRVRSEPASREANGRQKEETHGEADEDITDDYLRSQKIERTAEKLDWFRHKRQTADNMCNARLNRLLAGVGQRYAEHQLEVVSKYINPSSHAADLILSGSRANRTTTPTSTFNGRRSISTDRIHLQGNDEHGSKFRFYTSNPFDV
ncbi:hypothetical protein LSH36_84g10039 [Paralvinella palmiformis]|uniref:Uncharacterized protein n=1 Tax=Paralvinella palmiformis TaxID=53620 RepID=A0AAD9K1U2_9ANNE|nr:hypothetical protein LSH36_84g10039 [Paralvinella palmiformis]